MENLNEVANTAANLEAGFHDSYFTNEHIGNKYCGCEILDVFIYQRGEEEKYPNEIYPKAIAVRDDAGNIYIHFNGTGDGNWGYNAAAYGGPPSRMQEEALKWFNGFMKEKVEGNQVTGNVYVSGHSQGGNNAQFVTIRSPYADYITNCIALDAPGFSHQFVEDSINLYGEAYYKQQCDKIWAYNGEFDYVSCLGQESIIPGGHTIFLEYTNSNKLAFDQYHAVQGLLNSDGKITIVNDDSAFRKFIVEAMQKIQLLPQDEQMEAANIVMAICETYIADKDDFMVGDLTPEQFDRLKKILVPLIVDILAESPEKIVPVLKELGLDQRGAEAIAELIEQINSYPEEYRKEMVETFLDIVNYEDDEIHVDWLKLLPEGMVTVLPMIVETLRTHPQDIFDVLHEFGVDQMIMEWIKENPWQFMGISIAVVLTSPLWSIPVLGIFAWENLVDAIIRIVQGISGLVNTVKQAVVSFFTAIKNAIAAFAKWLRDNFHPGVQYVRANPYFKADTDRLRNYASRVNAVNRRLQSLDWGMNSLYWQVGLLDIWDILSANLLTGASPTLGKVESYLNHSADYLEEAERKAYHYIGG